ncbi:ubiquinone anaerobic biosynthesis protein UbiU [Chelatococcus asaccharovorans]|uniref:ubiquinone anaerobic biosynthesis protein UbiU n=1 Tax=Chelatococcus asaccharovorans TaxID=28210 RepID=UPI00224C66AC|nr:peptidase U32 family protein [Chelatococcus asaccharovorans]MCO5066429.1 U32 family peptidase [Rhizobiaceae bacterium]CAH1662082.1 ubiquinone biosynthesis protein UbiU [Chelatococcus asaccharovorans]CAH1690577.1 ubiquinone biosynthesis protein UbiU [Chelatococcus asaccharovorans]
MSSTRIELVCPAGTPATLRAAVQAGADAVYCGFRDETNARNFPGLNFSTEEMAEGVRFAHAHGSKVLVAINTFGRVGSVDMWRKAADAAAGCGADAIIAADIAVLDHVARNHRQIRLHLSVQAAAATPEAIGFYVETFGVRRVVLPRVLSIQEVATLNRDIRVETEAFVFGGLCVMTEGRCYLSSYATGKSPNLNGVCSPPEMVSYEEDIDGTVARLSRFTIDRYTPGAPVGYPTLCKGRFKAGDKTSYLFEDPVSLNAGSMIAGLKAAGVTALKIEGRQRGKGYVTEVVRTFRKAVDAVEQGSDAIEIDRILAGQSEGGRQTTGAYKKSWR